ncbi:DUF3558 family protein [Mycobacteroides abscessus]|uniref:DUF3558 family protein n=2 Tax=Mycobacteroides abscessus TaxID=36809 RepID=UPI0009A64A88|nr:DUF3558 family protein [Mycobacteroides abscessus]SKG55874.1 Uncharacterised protein [Mycobacteroides abscessus subsp. bolletii]SKG94146.1 Uncharacterised protein [Mycobacteroides abscessus subsp. bolletii]SKH79131.1 Uncharacterised protein [Mycobacteroides abscessus subsp. bolletii]SKH87006.1 Uncharacterised protein [Mycobacteroides abscessus subsp. bolletii]SKH96379.1 Uncharacterised protein [Mycobacteroides abscessus subsp. bolletii]
MNKQAGALALAVLGLAMGCQSQKTEPSGASSSSPEPTAATSSSSSEAKTSGFQPFTPTTDACSLVAPEQLNSHGTAPITSRARESSNRIVQCSYKEADGHELLNVKLFKNSDGAANFRSIHVRILESEGAQIYVMKDEPNECEAGLVNSEDNIVQFEFEPGDAAVSAAALPTGQTWCDFSAPVLAEANKKLGWTK